eukprot:3065939-Prymnesium_polylepis.1
MAETLVDVIGSGQAILDVVMGTDGKLYERSSLLVWLTQEAADVFTSSPITKEPMDTEITEVPNKDPWRRARDAARRGPRHQGENRGAAGRARGRPDQGCASGAPRRQGCHREGAPTPAKPTW